MTPDVQPVQDRVPLPTSPLRVRWLRAARILALVALSVALVPGSSVASVVDRSRPAPGPEQLPANATIELTDGSMSPRQVTINVGERVTFVHGGGSIPLHVIHDIPDHSWRVSVLPDRSGSHTFDEPGVVEIRCYTDPLMAGRVNVVAAATPKPATPKPATPKPATPRPATPEPTEAPTEAPATPEPTEEPTASPSPSRSPSPSASRSPSPSPSPSVSATPGDVAAATATASPSTPPLISENPTSNDAPIIPIIAIIALLAGAVTFGVWRMQTRGKPEG